MKEKKLFYALTVTNGDRIFYRKMKILLLLMLFGMSTTVFEANATLQQKVIQGLVSSESGETVPGASVIVKGTTIGTTTDIDGKFTLTVPTDARTLVISFVGMETQEVRISDKAYFEITLKESAVLMDEIVAVGYGAQKKESVVGSISQAQGEDIRSNIQGADFKRALTGSVPGMISLQSTGIPGGMDMNPNSNQYQDTQLFIRGKKTWNDAGPLVLVDGVEREMHNINPYDVEQISVLKDASATAVFGVKGANGVILITTRSGKKGKAQITFDYTATVKTLSRLDLTMMNAYDANTFKNYVVLNEVGIDETSWKDITPQPWVEYYKTQQYPEYFPDIDWRDELIKDFTVDHNYNLTLSGGTDLVKYFSTISYLQESDIINQGDVGQGFDPSFAFQRLNLRSNLDFSITPTTNLRVNLTGNYLMQRKSSGGLNAFRGIWFMAPDVFPAKYSDGTYAFDDRAVNLTNPFWEFNHMGYTRYTGTGINTDFTLDQKLDFLTEGLSVSAKLAYDNSARTSGPHVSAKLPMSKFIYPSIVDDPNFNASLSETELYLLEQKHTLWNYARLLDGGDWSHGYDFTQGPNQYSNESLYLDLSSRTLMYEFRLSYLRNFGKHEASGLALMSRQQQSKGSVFPSYREDWVGRGTYNYDRRYLLEVNAAYNGSEKFGQKYRFGLFPSVAVGWVASNEAFFTNLKPYFSNLKFRYSNGVVGSDSGIERWLYTSSYVVYPETASKENIFRFGAPYLQTAYPLRYEGAIANPDIQWEQAHKIDYGVEAGFFNQRLQIDFDYFKEHRTNVFLIASERIIPQYFGADPVSANVGEVDVHGWELAAEWKQQTAIGLNYWFKYAWAFSKDKIINKGDPELKPAYQKQAGFPIDQPRDILSQGKYNSYNSWNDIYNAVGPQDQRKHLQPGDFMRIDFNSDGRINGDDKVPIGYTYRPEYSYSPSAGISYKNLSAMVAFYGVYNVTGGIGSDYYRLDFAPELQDRVQNVAYENAWLPELNNITNAKLRATRWRTTGVQGYVSFPNSFIRLETAEIAYNLTSQNIPLLQSIGVSNLRLTLRGNNLFLISDMVVDRDLKPTGIDDRAAYPLMRRYNLGISINF